MKIGWIGTGVMGGTMAGHLLAAGHTLTVFTRTRSKAEALLGRGARWADDAAQAAAGADAVGVMVGYPADVEEVVLGKRGALGVMQTGALLIDFTTSSPDLAAQIEIRARQRGILALDAPVSGGDIGAREARLSIMVGGTAEAFAKALPLLRCLGKNIVHQGAAGSGQQTKMVNQIMIAANMLGICEGLLYARRAELDPQKVLEAVEGGAAGSWSLSNLYPRILKGDLQPGFYVEHFLKDLRIALDEAARMNLKLPGLALAHRMYELVRAGGGERLGTQALILALEQLNAVNKPGRD